VLERRTPVQPYRVTRSCSPECAGEMTRVPSGVTKPGAYPHQCSACGRQEVLDRTYPFIHYEEWPDALEDK